MQHAKRPEYPLYVTNLAPKSLPALSERYNDGTRLHILYTPPVGVIPTALDYLILQQTLVSFAAAGHRITILVSKNNDADAVKLIVNRLTAIAPKKGSVIVQHAHELLPKLDIPAVFASLESWGLRDLIGSYKGVVIKNSTRPISSILTEGINLAMWGLLAADMVVRLVPRHHMPTKPHLSSPSTTVPRILDVPTLSAIVKNDNSVVFPSDLNKLFKCIMAVPDSALAEVYRRTLFLREDEVPRITQLITKQPYEAKKQLATIISAVQGGSFDAGLQAREVFELRARNAAVAETYIDIRLLSGTSVFELLAAASFCSRSELRRLFDGNAVRLAVEGAQPLTADYLAVQPGDIIRVGKKRLVRILTS